MEATISRPSNWKGKRLYVLRVMWVMVLVHKCSGTQFMVGGSNGWTLPPTGPNASTYNQWAEHTRFLIGDSLLFVYKPEQDSVLEVTKEDYTNCTTTSPITKLEDGHSVFTFNTSGPYYFITGNRTNCLNNQKLIIVVLADRTNLTSNTTTTPSPSPSPSSPSPSPSGGSTDHDNIVPSPSPSPSPSGEESPPAETGEINPTPPATPKTNAASPLFPTSVGLIGAFLASSLALGSFI